MSSFKIQIRLNTRKKKSNATFTEAPNHFFLSVGTVSWAKPLAPSLRYYPNSTSQHLWALIFGCVGLQVTIKSQTESIFPLQFWPELGLLSAFSPAATWWKKVDEKKHDEKNHDEKKQVWLCCSLDSNSPSWEDPGKSRTETQTH